MLKGTLANECHKQIEELYEQETHRYRSEANVDIHYKDIDEGRIRKLEEILFYFGDRREFDFQNCY